MEQYELAFAAGKHTPGVIGGLRSGYKEARQLDKLLELDSRLTSLAPQNAALHCNFGLTLAQAGRLTEAIQQYHLAIELEPKNAEVFNNLGVAYYRQKDVRRAIDCYQQALDRNPDYAEAYYNLGGLLYQLNAIQDAIPLLETAVRLKPDYVRADFVLAKCYQAIHQDVEAARGGRGGAEGRPSNAPGLRRGGNRKVAGERKECEVTDRA